MEDEEKSGALFMCPGNCGECDIECPMRIQMQDRFFFERLHKKFMAGHERSGELKDLKEDFVELFSGLHKHLGAMLTPEFLLNAKEHEVSVVIREMAIRRDEGSEVDRAIVAGMLLEIYRFTEKEEVDLDDPMVRKLLLSVEKLAEKIMLFLRMECVDDCQTCYIAKHCTQKKDKAQR